MAAQQEFLAINTLVWIVMILLVQGVACRDSNQKRMSSNCWCANKGICLTMEDGSKVCQCAEGFKGTMCEYDCSRTSTKECRKLYNLENCGRHFYWMQECCPGTCEVNPCDRANPLTCEAWVILSAACKNNPSWMKVCCGSCHECDVHDSTKCSQRQKEGECKTNRRWMYKNCLKSCGGC